MSPLQPYLQVCVPQQSQNYNIKHLNHSVIVEFGSLILSHSVQYYGLRSEIESYRETARAIRIIGRECIQKRITAIENGEEVPNDILTSALKAAGEFPRDLLQQLIPLTKAQQCSLYFYIHIDPLQRQKDSLIYRIWRMTSLLSMLLVWLHDSCNSILAIDGV